MREPVDLGVFVAVRNEAGAYLVVKHNYGDRKWSLPGGGVDQGEIINLTALRELGEETGFEGKIGNIIGIFSLRKKRGVVVLIECKIVGGCRKSHNNNTEISASEWRRPNDFIKDEIYPGQLNLLFQAEKFHCDRETIYGHLTPDLIVTV